MERTIAQLGSDAAPSTSSRGSGPDFDAERVRRGGVRPVEVTSGAGCHLTLLWSKAAEALDPESGSWLFIENVGNLVCPALFDVGENAKVVIISVTEGQDKPLKYPHMFSVAIL